MQQQVTIVKKHIPLIKFLGPRHLLPVKSNICILFDNDTLIFLFLYYFYAFAFPEEDASYVSTVPAISKPANLHLHQQGPPFTYKRPQLSEKEIEIIMVKLFVALSIEEIQILVGWCPLSSKYGVRLYNRFTQKKLQLRIFYDFTFVIVIIKIFKKGKQKDCSFPICI